MTRFAHRKSLVVPLIIIGLGLFITSLAFVYYGFHLGIEPCKGLPTDAANCGDADMGGVGFILIGAPITLVGVVSVIVYAIADRIKRT